MEKAFIEHRDESYYLIGSRVPLAILIREFRAGESPEAIRSHYPHLSLEQIYGAITFYLGNQDKVERDLAERDRREHEFIQAHPTPDHLKRKLERARQEV